MEFLKEQHGTQFVQQKFEKAKLTKKDFIKDYLLLGCHGPH